MSQALFGRATDAATAPAQPVRRPPSARKYRISTRTSVPMVDAGAFEMDEEEERWCRSGGLSHSAHCDSRRPVGVQPYCQP
jgi:hypothetical protein